MESEAREKAANILQRLIYIDNSHKQMYKFDDMIQEDDNSVMIDPHPNYEEGIFIIRNNNYNLVLL